MVIGRSALVSIVTPQGNVDISAKIDTGAYSTSIDYDFFHSLNLNEEVLKKRLVKNAHGVSDRDVYEIDIIIKGKKISCELNVSDRSKMRHKMIIGRKDIIKLNALVDVRIRESIKNWQSFTEANRTESHDEIELNKYFDITSDDIKDCVQDFLDEYLDLDFEVIVVDKEKFFINFYEVGSVWVTQGNITKEKYPFPEEIMAFLKNKLRGYDCYPKEVSYYTHKRCMSIYVEKLN